MKTLSLFVAVAVSAAKGAIRKIHERLADKMRNSLK